MRRESGICGKGGRSGTRLLKKRGKVRSPEAKSKGTVEKRAFFVVYCWHCSNRRFGPDDAGQSANKTKEGCAADAFAKRA